MYLMPTEDAFNGCNFTSAALLADTEVGGGGTSGFANLYEAVLTQEGTYYFAGGSYEGLFCTLGQKITVVVTPPPVHGPTRLAFQRRKYGDRASGVEERTTELAAAYLTAAPNSPVSGRLHGISTSRP